MEAAGQRLRQGGQLRVRPLGHRHALGVGHQAVVGKAAVHGDTHSLHMMAHLLLPLTAGAALAAVNVGVHGNQLAHLQAGDTAAQLHHIAGKLMAQNHRGCHIRRALAPLVDVHIGAADTAGADLYQNLPLSGLRKNQGAGFNRFIAKKICTNHCCSS